MKKTLFSRGVPDGFDSKLGEEKFFLSSSYCFLDFLGRVKMSDKESEGWREDQQKKKKKRIESKERSMPLIEGGGRIEENLQNKSPSDFKILLVRKNL